jgi:UDP-2-acetamido-2,6-beta-L-arabino-hexul-4-ose reductase
MLKIGITGQEGFIGQHVKNTLRLFPDEFQLIEFERNSFDDDRKLLTFVASCDTILHLAALNRHEDQQFIYDTNIRVVEKLITALKNSQSKAHVLFSSSSQEERPNLYGQSKKIGRQLLAEWATTSGGFFTGLIVPNVFGPFGLPYYNSFIATFSHQLTHGEEPLINIDGDVKLIYIDELVKLILDKIRNRTSEEYYQVPATSEAKVTEILKLLKSYKEYYFDNGVIPEIKTTFEKHLFNTFRSFIDLKNHYPVKFTQNTDPRGTFVEVVRLSTGGQVSFSTTVPGVTRGNHFHTRKIERFAVIKGNALIQLRKIGSNEVVNFNLNGDNPAYVDMPVWYTHNIKNTGSDELLTIFWINEFYDPNDPDTYFEQV